MFSGVVLGFLGLGGVGIIQFLIPYDVFVVVVVGIGWWKLGVSVLVICWI